MDYAELISFLSTGKPIVVEQAAVAVLELSESPDFLEYVRHNPKQVARPLLRVVEKDCIKTKTAGLNAVVNLSGIPEVIASMLVLNGIRRICDVMENLWQNGVDKDAVELCTMILSNLTTVEEGQVALCEETRSLNFLIPMYLSPPVAKSDVFFHIGGILKNITGLRKGREVVADPRVVQGLSRQLIARHRRAFVVGIFRNLCGDKECHKILSDCEFLPQMQCFLYPDEAVKPEHTTLHPIVEQERQGLSADEGIRFNAAETLLFFARTTCGREAMRRDCIYECVRAWHLEETQDDVKEILENLVPYIHFSEDELDAEGATDATAEIPGATDATAEIPGATDATAEIPGATDATAEIPGATDATAEIPEDASDPQTRSRELDLSGKAEEGLRIETGAGA